MHCFPYLCFNGNAEEAIKFYQKAIGGETLIMHYEDMPGVSPQSLTMPENKKKYVMNGVLDKAGVPVLMVSDNDEPIPANISSTTYVNVSVDTLAEAEQAWAVLKEGAKIIMPFEETFWAERYAMFIDKFGINWMINYFGKNKM